MDPVTAAALGTMGGGLLGGLLGGDGDEERRRALELLLQTNVETGDVAPEMRRSMSSAVDYLRDLYSQGGMDAQSRAALGQAQESNAARERMSRGAIGQNMAARGVGGSGVDVAAQLANQQGAANRNAMAGTQAAADARQRAIGALMGSANLAGNVRGQDSALAQFNASQRLRRAAAAAGQLNQNAGAADAAGSQTRQDFGNLGGFLGAGLSGLGGGGPSGAPRWSDTMPSGIDDENDYFGRTGVL